MEKNKLLQKLITGTLAGNLSALTGMKNVLRFDIALENKAITDYRDLIEKVREPEIRDLLWNNMIDEELHTSWMQDALEDSGILNKP